LAGVFKDGCIIGQDRCVTSLPHVVAPRRVTATSLRHSSCATSVTSVMRHIVASRRAPRTVVHGVLEWHHPRSSASRRCAAVASSCTTSVRHVATRAMAFANHALHHHASGSLRFTCAASSRHVVRLSLRRRISKWLPRSINIVIAPRRCVTSLRTRCLRRFQVFHHGRSLRRCATSLRHVMRHVVRLRHAPRRCVTSCAAPLFVAFQVAPSSSLRHRFTSLHHGVMRHVVASVTAPRRCVNHVRHVVASRHYATPLL
jgi:hypothetical protein